VHDWNDQIGRRLRGHLPPARELEIIEELAQHLEDRYSELRSRLHSDEAALQAALAELDDEQALDRGLASVERAAARSQEPLGHSPSDHLLRDLSGDLRHGVRLLGRAPVVTIIAVLTLALGIGANKAIYSVVSAMLLRPLPFPHAEQLVRVMDANPSLPSGRQSLSPADIAELRESAPSLTDLAVFQIPSEGFSFVEGDVTEQRFGTLVSSRFFSMLGVSPLLGRTFVAGDDVDGAAPGAVVSYRFWQDRLSGDPNVVGRRITLSGVTMPVIGVMPEGFWFPRGDRADFWVNLIVPRPTRMGPWAYQAIARLRPGVSAALLQKELDAVAARVRARFPGGADRWTLIARPLRDELAGDMRPALYLLAGAVALVLLIACVNVTNLLLVRATERAQEIAVRATLGASRGRLVRQLLAEGVVLAALGTVVGLGIAYAGVRTLLRLAPANLALLHDVHVSIDLRTLVVTAGVALGVAILCSALPAILLSRTQPGETVRAMGRSVMDSRAHRRVRTLLVASELALSLMLAIGAGLLLRSLARLQSVDAGVRREEVLTATVSLPGARYPRPEDMSVLYDRLLANVRLLPGVEQAGLSYGLPPDQLLESENFLPGTEPHRQGQEEPIADRLSVAGHALQALGVPLRRGRFFDARDGADAPPVVIINETMAKRYFPSGDPIGQQMRIGWTAAEAPLYTIVGIVGDVRYHGLARPPEPGLYTVIAQTPVRTGTIVLRTRADPDLLVAALRRTVTSLDPTLVLGGIRTMADLTRDASSRARFRTTLVLLFAAVAILLAAVGIYGVTSYSVRARTREIGLRVALGARSADVIGLVLRQSAVQLAAGILAGVVGGAILSRIAASILFGVGTLDPVTFVCMPLLVAAIALLASWIPARRATHVDPLEALKNG
jgi:putative ABC transport system permease protein